MERRDTRVRQGGRRRQRARLWPLLGIVAAGAVGAAAVVLLTRRRTIDLGPVPEGEGWAESEAGPEQGSAPVPDVSVWIAGPAGNLYVRDGGDPEGGVPVLFVHSLGGNSG